MKSLAPWNPAKSTCGQQTLCPTLTTVSGIATAFLGSYTHTLPYHHTFHLRRGTEAQPGLASSEHGQYRGFSRKGSNGSGKRGRYVAFSFDSNPIPSATNKCAVYQHVRRRMRNLKDVWKLLKEQGNQASLLAITVSELRELGAQYLLNPKSPSRLETKSHIELADEVNKAGLWLLTTLAHQEKQLDREHQIWMFRRAVEKELGGAMAEWSDIEKLYMALTNLDIPDPTLRLKHAFIVALHFNFAEHLQDVSQFASQRGDAIERTATLHAEIAETREQIVERSQHIRVDHFACAIPLSALQPRPDVFDENEGCCPICQNSYTDTSTNPLQDLLSDFPVRIKYCGHIIGKGCLERWMATPKMNELKHPHRLCPVCRTQIEGVPSPKAPDELRKHLKTNRRAMETLQELVYGYDMEVDECLEAILAHMSEEIAVEQITGIMANEKTKTGRMFSEEESVLKQKAEDLRKEKSVWGFRGEGVWNALRDEWMHAVGTTQNRSRRWDV